MLFLLNIVGQLPNQTLPYFSLNQQTKFQLTNTSLDIKFQHQKIFYYFFLVETYNRINRQIKLLFRLTNKQKTEFWLTDTLQH